MWLLKSVALICSIPSCTPGLPFKKRGLSSYIVLECTLHWYHVERPKSGTWVIQRNPLVRSNLSKVTQQVGGRFRVRTSNSILSDLPADFAISTCLLAQGKSLVTTLQGPICQDQWPPNFLTTIDCDGGKGAGSKRPLDPPIITDQSKRIQCCQANLGVPYTSTWAVGVWLNYIIWSVPGTILNC